jgi:hypothetical protein
MKRKLAIATMHHKEQVIAPLFESIGFDIVVEAPINTDVLGTFSGEVERTLSPLDAAIAKCKLAIEQTGISCAVASEGSFGPHPQYYWLASNEELVVFVDIQSDIQLWAKVLTTETNFAAATCNTIQQVQDFCEQVQFPSHGIIVKKSKEDFSEIKKGVQSGEDLFLITNDWIDKYGSVYLETDMRAMHNPTRMHTIEQATQKLIEKYNSKCPQCTFPGFEVSEVIRGLPCAACGLPTSSAMAYVYNCKKCNYTQQKKYPKGIKLSNPQFCAVCNP